VLGARTGIFVV